MTTLFRQIEVTFWDLDLSADAQRVGLWLISGPCTTQLPGVVVDVGPGRISDVLGIDYEDVRTALSELVTVAGWRYDARARLLWRPEGVLKHPPSNPNVVTGWRYAWGAVPRCALAEEIEAAFTRVIDPRGDLFAEAWATVRSGAIEPTQKSHQGKNRFENGSGNGWANGSREGSGNDSPNPSPNGSPNPSANGSGKGSAEGSGNGSPNGSRNEDRDQRIKPREDPDPERERVLPTAPPAAPTAAVVAPAAPGNAVRSDVLPKASIRDVVAPSVTDAQVDAAIEAYRNHCKPLPQPPPPPSGIDAGLRAVVAKAIALDPAVRVPSWWAGVAKALGSDAHARGRRWSLAQVLSLPEVLERYAERAKRPAPPPEAPRQRAAGAPTAEPAQDAAAALRMRLEAELARLEGRASVGDRLSEPERARMEELRALLNEPPAVKVIERGETRIELDGDGTAPRIGELRTRGQLAARKAETAKYSARARRTSLCPLTLGLWPLEVS